MRQRLLRPARAASGRSRSTATSSACCASSATRSSASLIAPRTLVVEAVAAAGGRRPAAPRDGRQRRRAGPTARRTRRRRGESRAGRATRRPADAGPARSSWSSSGDGQRPFGSDDALAATARRLGTAAGSRRRRGPPSDRRDDFDPQPRQQAAVRPARRRTPSSSCARATHVRAGVLGEGRPHVAPREVARRRPSRYREHFDDEVIGRFDRPAAAAEPAHAAGLRRAEVHRLRSGARRLPGRVRLRHPAAAQGPQARREAAGRRLPARAGRPAAGRGRPEGRQPAYHRFAGQLAERGFITFAPQNPYIFEDRFRTLQRKANPLGKTLFSIIVPQHQQIARLARRRCRSSMPSGSPSTACRYGGKTAMRVPALREATTACRSARPTSTSGSGRTRRVDCAVQLRRAPASTRCSSSTWATRSTTPRWPRLIAPRPFMVERGHYDGVAPDEWVAYEFAKVRQLVRRAEHPRAHDDRILRRPAHDPRRGDVRVPAQAPELAEAVTHPHPRYAGARGQGARAPRIWTFVKARAVSDAASGIACAWVRRRDDLADAGLVEALEAVVALEVFQVRADRALVAELLGLLRRDLAAGEQPRRCARGRPASARPR